MERHQLKEEISDDKGNVDVDNLAAVLAAMADDIAAIKRKLDQITQ